MEITKKFNVVLTETNFKKVLEAIQKDNEDVTTVNIDEILKANETSKDELFNKVRNIESKIIVLDRPETGSNGTDSGGFVIKLADFINSDPSRKVVILTHCTFTSQMINVLVALGSMNYNNLHLRDAYNRFDALKSMEGLDCLIHFKDTRCSIVEIRDDDLLTFREYQPSRNGLNVDWDYIFHIQNEQRMYHAVNELMHRDEKMSKE